MTASLAAQRSDAHDNVAVRTLAVRTITVRKDRVLQDRASAVRVAAGAATPTTKYSNGYILQPLTGRGLIPIM
jgi:hypothetical protein